jgi:hypothetical protein
MKQTFELTITDQKRVITTLLLFPIVIFATAFISVKFNAGLGVLSFFISLFLLYYFVIGKLTVSIEDEKISFQWKKKIIFNYKDIQDLDESKIDKVIIDNGQFLRKIVAKDRTINLSTSKIKPKDSYRLISHFNKKGMTQNLEIKNSWENINPKRLKVFYVLTWIMILASILLLIFISIFKGFRPKMLFILGVIPMLLMYGKQIKNAIEKNDINNN